MDSGHDVDDGLSRQSRNGRAPNVLNRSRKPGAKDLREDRSLGLEERRPVLVVGDDVNGGFAVSRHECGFGSGLPNGSRLSCGATRSPRAVSLNDSSCAPAHNTPIPLERSPPASFKRMLDGALS